MARNAFDVGDRVKWPKTTEPATDSTERYLTVADRLDTRYKSGAWYFRYLYADLIERVVEDMHSNISEDYDNVLMVAGGEGKGKSNISYYIAKTFDPEMDISKTLVYSWDQFLESVLSDHPQRVYWFDEAALVASNRDWNKEENTMLYKAVQVVRSMRLVIIFNIPSVRAIDAYIREFRTRYLIKAHEMRWNKDSEARRGYGEFFFALTEDERKRLKNPAPEDFYRSVGYFEFPRMAGEDKRIYDEMKAKIQKQSLADMLEQIKEKREGKSRYARDKKSLEALVSYLADVQGMKYQEIADIAGMPYNTVKTMAWRVRNGGNEDE